MRLFELQAIMKECALNVPMVKQYSDLDIYMTCNTGEVQYPILCAAIQYMTVKEQYISYTFQVYLADRLINDDKNRNDVIASEFDRAEEWVKLLKASDGILDVEYDRQWNTGQLPQLMDVCQCVYGQVTIEVRKEYDEC